MPFACIVYFLEIFIQSDVSLTGTRLPTRPKPVRMTVCPGGYVVLNCSVQDIPLVWNISTQKNSTQKNYTRISCPTDPKHRSLCQDGTRTSYAIVNKHHAGRNITSFLTIIDINKHTDVDCIGPAGIQESYVLLQSMYVAILLL